MLPLSAMSTLEKHCRLNHPMDHKVPGQTYLCQVDETISCGACCGLYNVPDLDRQNLSALLEQRTARFAVTPRTPAAIDAFALESADAETVIQNHLDAAVESLRAIKAPA
jgi:hypothetical protein